MVTVVGLRCSPEASTADTREGVAGPDQTSDGSGRVTSDDTCNPLSDVVAREGRPSLPDLTTGPLLNGEVWLIPVTSRRTARNLTRSLTVERVSRSPSHRQIGRAHV